MAAATTSFKLTGPIFGTPAQVGLGFAEAVNRGLLDLATIEGSNKVLEQLWGPPVSQYNKAPRSAKHGRKTGELRRHVGASKVRDYLVQVDAGEARYGSNLVYANWVEGISNRNARTSFKGYHMFRDAYDHINNNPELYEQYIGDALIEAFD